MDRGGGGLDKGGGGSYSLMRTPISKPSCPTLFLGGGGARVNPRQGHIIAHTLR